MKCTAAPKSSSALFDKAGWIRLPHYHFLAKDSAGDDYSGAGIPPPPPHPQGPTTSPWAKWASRALTEIVILCALAGLPGGIWQMVILSPVSVFAGAALVNGKAIKPIAATKGNFPITLTAFLIAFICWLNNTIELPVNNRMGEQGNRSGKELFVIPLE